MSTNFLYLNEAEMIQAGVLDYANCVDVLEEMFQLLGEGDYVLGGENHNSHGIGIKFPEAPKFPNMPKDGPDRRFMAMIGYLGGRFNVCGEKWYGSNIINPERNLPRSILMVMLNNADTCEPMALMSGNLISAVRTGSVPGVVVRHLANPKDEVCTCVGAGPISRACFEGIFAAAPNLKKLVVYDLFKDKSEAFCEWAKEKYGIEGYAADSLEEAVCMGDIISVAASAAKPVNVKDAWLKKGSTIIFTGRCNIEESYYKSCKIAFDNKHMYQEYYDTELRKPENERFTMGQIGMEVMKMKYEGKLPPMEESISLGDVICGTAKVRTSADDRVCFITGGIPAEDIAWGYEVYTKAKEMGLGIKLDLWPTQPYQV